MSLILILISFVTVTIHVIIRAQRTRSSSRLSYERRLAGTDVEDTVKKKEEEEGKRREEESDPFNSSFHKSVRGRGSRDGGTWWFLCVT